MGTINTILDKVVPRVQRREHENKPLIDIINEEIEKEKCLGTEQSNQSTYTNKFNDIVPLGTDIDNGEIYNTETGQTIKEL